MGRVDDVCVAAHGKLQGLRSACILTRIRPRVDVSETHLARRKFAFFVIGFTSGFRRELFPYLLLFVCVCVVGEQYFTA